jgi:serine protease Do
LRVKGVERGGAAAKAGLREGDVILQLNRQEVKTLEEFVAALGKRSKGRDHLVLYSRNGMNNFTTLEAGK